MIISRQVDVHSPGYMGVNDVLVCGGRIEAVGDHLEGGNGCSKIDARGYFLIPGLIDQYEYIIGGGSEGGFRTRTPGVQLSALIQAGIITILGLLGTDDMTRGIEGLVAKAKGLKEEGVTASALCRAYGYPSPMITGNMKKDVVFVDKILNLKLVPSDHRASNISAEELIRLAGGVRTAGMISRKFEFIILYMGDGERRLDQVFEALERTDIPMKIFHPIRMFRMPESLQSGFKLTKIGGYIDITYEGGERIQGSRPGTGWVMGILKETRNQEVPMDHIIFSSDGRGSWSSYGRYGRLKEIGVTNVGNIYRQLKYLAIQGKMDLSEALFFFTSNVVKALEAYPRKGCITPEADADLLLIRPDMTLDTVMAGDRVMMAEGDLEKEGTYEAEY